MQLRDEEDEYISQNTPDRVFLSTVDRDNRSTVQQSSHVAFVAFKVNETQIKSFRDSQSSESDYSCQSDSRQPFRKYLSSREIGQGKYYTGLVVAYVVSVVNGVKQVEHNR